MSQIINRSAPGALLGEGPLWSRRDQCVYWVDILGQKLHAYGLDGQTREWRFEEPICWVIEREQGGFVAGFKSGFAFLTLDPFLIEPIANPYRSEPDNRLNDAKADRRGRIYAGSMHMPQSKVSGCFYRLNKDLSIDLIDQPYGIANGPAFNGDETKLYHTDTARQTIYVFDIDASGEPRNRRDFVQFPDDWGSPDGMTSDADDGLWVAHWGASRLSRFLSDGRLDYSVTLPAQQITSLCFAGDRLDRVFVTSAAIDNPDDAHGGTLFELSPDLVKGVKGLEPARFGA